MKKTKLKDIAEALGVSITTVSRALNNKSDINQSTKMKILEMAYELDYRPNNLAISLRKNKISNIIGVIIPLVDHFFFSSVLKGIMQNAQSHNFLVIVGESNHIVSKEKQVLDEFMQYGVTGILLAPCMDSSFEDNLLPIIHRRIPTVVMDRMYEHYNGNYVLTDDFEGSYQAVKHLINQGYKHIAHIGSTDKRSVGLERQKGYKKALEDHNIPLRNEHLLLINLQDSELAIKKGYQTTKRLFESHNPPDAIFTVTDDVAIGVYEYAREKNINIPNDLGVVGFSNSQISKYLSPKLSTVEQNGVAMGNMAFDYIYQALQSSGMIFQKIFESKLLIRESSSPSK